MKKWFNSLDGNNQFKVVVTIIIIVAILYIFVIRPKIKALGSAVTPRAELALLAAQGIKPTHPDNIYEQCADMLFEAMQGLGTKEHTIMAVYKVMRNDADMIKLDLAFGKRPGSSKIGVTKMYDLREWINDDLDGADVLKINNMLRSKGITRTL